ncbi:MAG: SulP family inorganic anion transporter [Thermomicrobiales bacterium]
MDQIKNSLSGLGQRVGLKRKLPVSKQDGLAAITVGIANVPDGMASGVLAGVNPVYGIYTLMVGTPIAALTCSTQLMMFNTTSAMTLVATDALGTRTGDDRVHALIAVALIAGVFQLAMGLLGLGMIIKFVSNAVMVGFLTGIAALIIMGQLWDLTGYVGEGGTKLEKTAQLLTNLRDVDIPTTAIGVGSIVLMVILGRTRFASFNLLIALAAAAAVQWIFDFSSVSLVSEIPRELPSIQLPELSVVPAMLLAGVATGVVGLLQAAGVAQAFPNPDGSETSNSRDFMGQGIANIASSFFRGMAGGGSLSGTALNVSAGARSRYAAVIQAVVVVIVVLVFSDLLSMIPNAALAALLIYAAALSIKWDAIGAVRRTSSMSMAAMVLTFLATLVVPLQQAIIFGVVVASVLFIYRSSTDIRIQQVSIDGNRLIISDPPKALTDNSVTVLDVEGNLFYAGARTLSEKLPDATAAVHSVVVLRLREQAEVGSTFFKVVGKYAEQLRGQGGRLILTGVAPQARERMQRTGNLDLIGEENVLLANQVLGQSTIAGYQAGTEWLLGTMPAETLLEADATQPEPATVAAAEPAQSADQPGAMASVFADRSNLLAHAKNFLDANLLGDRATTWRSAAVAGIVILATGLIGVLSPGLLDNVFLWLTGVILVLVSGFWIYQSLLHAVAVPAMGARLRMFSAGIAMMAGIALILAELAVDMTTGSARLILGCGLILIGSAGIVGAWYLPEGTPDRLAAIGVNGVIIALGVFILIQVDDSRSFFEQLMWLMVVGGGALLAYAFFGFRQMRHALSDSSAPDESS